MDLHPFVIGGLREMFPDIFEDIEFQSVSNQLFARFILPGRQESVPVYLAPNGWLVALTHLCAIASVRASGARRSAAASSSPHTRPSSSTGSKNTPSASS